MGTFNMRQAFSFMTNCNTVTVSKIFFCSVFFNVFENNHYNFFFFTINKRLPKWKRFWSTLTAPFKSLLGSNQASYLVRSGWPAMAFLQNEITYPVPPVPCTSGETRSHHPQKLSDNVPRVLWLPWPSFSHSGHHCPGEGQPGEMNLSVQPLYNKDQLSHPE